MEKSKIIDYLKNAETISIGIKFLQFLHLTWSTHQSYFFRETALSLLNNTPITEFYIITSILPEYIRKKFSNCILLKESNHTLHHFEIIWNNCKIHLISVDDYPFLEMFYRKYAIFTSDLLFLKWNLDIYDPFNISYDILENKIIKQISSETVDISIEKIKENTLKLPIDYKLIKSLTYKIDNIFNFLDDFN